MNDEMRIEVGVGENRLVFSPESPFGILAGGLSGFDGLEVQLRAESTAGGRGCWVTGQHLLPRKMKIRFEIAARNVEEDGALRERIRRVAVPGRECEIAVETGECFRGITAKVTEVRFERDTVLDLTVAELSFLAPEPFFMGADAVRGTVSSGAEGSVAENEGEVPCGAVFTLCAQGGTVVNPSVSCGERKVRVERELNDGDVLTIDTRWGRKAVRINGEVCLHFDWRSSFFSLEVGENTVTVDADVGKEFMAVSYELRPLFIGI